MLFVVFITLLSTKIKMKYFQLVPSDQKRKYWRGA